MVDAVRAAGRRPPTSETGAHRRPRGEIVRLEAAGIETDAIGEYLLAVPGVFERHAARIERLVFETGGVEGMFAIARRNVESERVAVLAPGPTATPPFPKRAGDGERRWKMGAKGRLPRELFGCRCNGRA